MIDLQKLRALKSDPIRFLESVMALLRALDAAKESVLAEVGLAGTSAAPAQTPLSKGAQVSKIRAATAWLAEYMADAETHHAQDVLDAGLSAGHADYLIRNAYKKLGGIKPVKAKGLDGAWLWKIGRVSDGRTDCIK